MASQRKFDAYGSGFNRRSFLVAGAATAAAAVSPAALGQLARSSGIINPPRYKRIPIQYIAALSDPKATSGNNAQLWGLWRQDPGPRGVRLDRYESLQASGGVAPAKWKFDNKDWWLEEHGLIMEQPEFPIPASQYVVTGDREVTTLLTVHPLGKDGNQRWELDGGASLYDVTHLRCRSARYTPASTTEACTPANARQSAFPVAPGAAMPPVDHCHKQDYQVLIVVGVPVANG
jgi:hypothetical protein